MPHWQDEISQQSSSGASSSEEGSVEIEEEHDPKVQQSSASPKNQGNKATSAQSPPVVPNGEGIPRRWIMDRIQGVVYNPSGRAPRPPCSLCWPPPVIGMCPMLLEENVLCTTMGRIGFCHDNSHTNRSDYYSQFGNRGRCAVMTYALVMNVAGLLVTIFAALAMTDANDKLIQTASFNSVDLMPTTATTTFPPVNLHLGLQALLVSDDQVVPFVDFCTTPGMEQFLPPEDCNVCHQTTLYVIIGLVVAMVAYLPTMVSSFLRQYQYYDVNCQKSVAFLWSLVSLAGYGLVFYYYNYVCLASFYQGEVLYDNNGNVLSGGGVVVVDFNWKMGNGQICALAGFALKCLDLLCNCCVATPIITRDRDEQWKYERLSEQAEQGIYVSEKSSAKEEGHDDNYNNSSSSEER